VQAPTGSQRPRFFYGWWVATAAFFATFGSVVFFNPVLGVFSQLLEEDFGWTRSEVALAISLGALVAAAASPLTGVILDRWGGRWVVVGSGIIMAICAIALSQMTLLWHLLLFYSIGRAASIAGMSPAGFVAAANWFVRRRATITGIVAVAPRIGMALFPVIVAVVIQATGNWRAGWFALAIIVLVSIIPALIFMRRRPEDMGLRPDGDPEPLDMEGLPFADRERTFTLSQSVRTRAYWLLSISIPLVMFCGGAINFHQIPHLVDQGLPRTQAALIVTIFSFTGAVGAIIGGIAAQRITMRWTQAIALVGMAASVLLLLNTTSFTTAAIYAVSYGAFFGVEVSINQVIYADYFGRKFMGTIRGSMQPIQLGMNAAGPYLVGLWYDRTGSYNAAFITFSVFFALAALAMVFASYPAPPAQPSEDEHADGHAAASPASEA